MGPGGHTQHAWRASAYQYSVKWNISCHICKHRGHKDVTRDSSNHQPLPQLVLPRGALRSSEACKKAQEGTEREYRETQDLEPFLYHR